MGSSPACTNLGYLHEKGTGVKKDAARAVALYQRGCDGTACQPSNLNGCVNVGRAYRDGIGVEKDAARSASFFRQACDREPGPDDPGAAENRSRACSLLGALYLAGDGVAKDPERGRQLSELGCERGDAFGCFNAAVTATDPSAAASFLAKACEAGAATIWASRTRRGRESAAIAAARRSSSRKPAAWASKRPARRRAARRGRPELQRIGRKTTDRTFSPSNCRIGFPALPFSSGAHS
jgi:TPR repeat protein